MEGRGGEGKEQLFLFFVKVREGRIGSEIGIYINLLGKFD